MVAQANVGTISRLSYAKEAVYGTPINPTTTLLPVKSAEFDTNPDYQDIQVMDGSGDATKYLIPGQQAVTGNATYPLLPDAGFDFIAGSIGLESETVGTTATGGSALSTTLSGAVTKGATTITLASTPAEGDILMIDDAGNGAECRKVSTVTGAGPYDCTLDQALDRAHADGATVTKVIAPFTHTLAPGLVLPSYTIETYQGGVGSVSSHQYAGALVSKLKFVGDNKTAPEVTPDFICQEEVLLDSGDISDPTAGTSQPITWDQTTALFGTAGEDADGTFTANTDLETMEIDVDNTAKSDFTQSGHLYATRVNATAKKITGKATFYYKDDATFWTPFKSKTPVAMQYKALNSAGYGVIWTFPQTVWAQYKRPFKFADFITEELSFTVKQDLTLGTQLRLSLLDAHYLPY